MLTAIRRFAAIALACVLLSACAATPAEPTPAPPTTTLMPTMTPAPTSMPTQTPTAAPAPTAAPTETPAPTPEPTMAPSPTPAPPIIYALYACEPGLCRYTLGDEQATELITALNPGLHGYALTPDGTHIIWGDESYPTGEVEILLADLDLGDTQGVFMLAGAASDDDHLGVQRVLGMTADGRVVFEDRSQLFVANRDGSDRRALLDVRPYGTSSFHSYTLSPTGLRVLYTMSGNPNRFELINTDTGALQAFDLPADRRPLALVDDTHVLVERFEPPVELGTGNPAAVIRWSLGFEVVSIEDAALGQPTALAMDASDDGRFTRSLISNVAGGWVLIDDDARLVGENGVEDVGQFWLLNVATGVRQPVVLPLYDGYSPVAIAVTKQ